MTLLGNILWFILGGWLLGLLYLLGAIVFFPLFPFLWPLVKFAFWPFGKEVVSRSDLEAYQRAHGVEKSAAQTTKNTVGLIGNILWALTFGWILALSHLVAAIINIAFIWLIVTIPNIGGNWKLITVAFAPFNRVIVPSELAREIKLTAAKKRIGI